MEPINPATETPEEHREAISTTTCKTAPPQAPRMPEHQILIEEIPDAPPQGHEPQIGSYERLLTPEAVSPKTELPEMSQVHHKRRLDSRSRSRPRRRQPLTLYSVPRSVRGRHRDNSASRKPHRPEPIASTPAVPFSVFGPHNPFPPPPPVGELTNEGPKMPPFPIPHPPVVPVPGSVQEKQLQLTSCIRRGLKRSDHEFAIQDEFLNWFARKLLDAGFEKRDIRQVHILKYQSWHAHKLNDPPKPPQYFAMVRLNDHEWDPVEVDTHTIFWAHGTTTAGLAGILKDRAMKPTRQFYEDQPEPFESFMCLGCLLTGSENDEMEKARIVKKTIDLPKNRCNVVAVGYATGKCSTVDQGGAWESLLKSKADKVVHDRRTKRWAVRCDTGKLIGVCFAENAQPGMF